MSTPSPQFPPLDNTFGAIFVGILVSTFLEGVLTLQCYIYFSNFKDDPPRLRGLVGLVWFLDTVHLAFISSMQYSYVITNYGDTQFLATALWQFDVSVILTSFVAFLIQVYFMRRTWVLTKSYVLTGAIFVLAMLSLGFGLACGAETFILKDFERFIVFRWGVGSWLGATAACDIVVAGSLCWALWRSKNGFQSTDTLLDRLIIWTLNTGMLTSIVAVIDLVCFVTMNNLVHFAFNVTLSKLYANMFVATLNQRLQTRSQGDTTLHARSHTATSLEFRNEMRRNSQVLAAFRPNHLRCQPHSHEAAHHHDTVSITPTSMTPSGHLNRSKTTETDQYDL